jgi:hypothetical protein
MYYDLYQKYINKNLTQTGGKYGFEFKYKGNPIQRQFSEENQILIERARQSDVSGIRINHIITQGVNVGQRKEFYISFMGIAPDDNSRTPRLFGTDYKLVNTGNVAIPIPNVKIVNVYSFKYNYPEMTREFNNENQLRINDMFINNREQIYLFENEYMIHIKREPLNIRVILPYLQQSELLSKTAYSFPSTIEINPEVNLLQETPIYINNSRVTEAEIRVLNQLGVVRIYIRRPEPDIEKLKCQRCHIWEKTLLLPSCRHLALCDSCSIIELNESGSVECPVCNTRTTRVIQVRE